MNDTEMTFLKIFIDMEDYFAPFTREEIGNLFVAMMRYTFHGEDANFKGNERFIWSVLKNHIDACAEKSRKNAENGAKGGRPPKPTETEENPEKAKETEQKRTKPKRTQQKPIQEQEQEHIHIQEHIQEQEQEHVVGGNDAHAHTHARTCEENDNGNEGSVTGIDGTPLDLSRAQHLDEAERLVKRFRLPLNETVLEAVADDIEAHGLDVVQAAFIKAAEGDTRGGLSLNFYRAVLLNKGSGKPTKGFAQNNMITHSPEDRRDFIRKAVVNLDDV